MERWVSRIVDGKRVSGPVTMTPEEEAEFVAYRTSLPPAEPTRDLAAEVDALKARLDSLESSPQIART